MDTWATVARGRGATGEATLHGGRESAWTALQLTALHHHLLASKLTLSNTQLISSMPRHPGYDVTGVEDERATERGVVGAEEELSPEANLQTRGRDVHTEVG